MALLGKKIGMTRLFREDGTLVPVTVIEAGPCPVLCVKTRENDGYNSLQLGFGQKKEKRVNKPMMGYFKKKGVKPVRFIREIRIEEAGQYKTGQSISVDIFNEKDLVDITGVSIGKGFQGGVKRWHWRGGPASHGSMHHRAPGSIGASSFPSRVLKGQHLPGHMGAEKKTVQNLEVVKIDKENNLLAVRGSVPGHKNSYLVIRKSKKFPTGKVVHVQEHKKKEGAAKPAAQPKK